MEFRQNALFGLLVVVIAAAALLGVVLWRTRENSTEADRQGQTEPTARVATAVSGQGGAAPVSPPVGRRPQTRPVLRSPPRGRDGGSAGESAVIERMTALVERDPAAALTELEGAALPSALDEERRLLTIRALVRLDRLSEARARAREYFDAHPSGRLRAAIESYTGVRPRPSR